MSKPMIRIHNTETNEIIDREMNDDEFNLHNALMAKLQEEDDLKAQKEAQKIEALSKLESLGLNLQDLKALGLG